MARSPLLTARRCLSSVILPRKVSYDIAQNLVKLAGGEYIAIERLESVYRSCRLVANICVVADPSANKPAAIVFPHEANLRAFVAEEGIEDKNDELKVLTDSDKVQTAALAELNAVGKRAGLKPLEVRSRPFLRAARCGDGVQQLQALVMTHEEWTPQCADPATSSAKPLAEASQERHAHRSAKAAAQGDPGQVQ